jgi:tripartite-type tricarboxylate transporter receptor subunit TctC
VTNGPAFTQTMKSLGAQSQWTSSTELAARIRKEYDRNGADITALNLTASQ